MDYPTLFLNIISGLLIAIVTAIVTVRLSLRQFYSQKWWGKRAEAYTSILESLHYMKRSFDEEFNADLMGRELSEARQKQLRKKFLSGYDELQKRLDISHFILSDEANKALKEFKADYQEAKDAPSWAEHLYHGLNATDTAIKKLSNVAKNDLKGH